MVLVDAFWEESTPYVRRLLLDEASGRVSGRVQFNFDTFDVDLDFDERSATVSDAIGDDAAETVGLASFLDRAHAFGDDPALGDGLTEMQRRPPQWTADPAGDVERRPPT